MLVATLREHYGVEPVIYATQAAYSRYIAGGFPDTPLWIRAVYLPPRVSDGRDGRSGSTPTGTVSTATTARSPSSTSTCSGETWPICAPCDPAVDPRATRGSTVLLVDTDEISIGRFGRLCGLSVHTLRHYDDVGLLTPARVDAATGYRYYLPDQLERARHIRSLRWTDLSVEDTRTVLDDPSRADAVLAAHRDRLERERARLSASLGDTERFADDGLPATSPPTARAPCRSSCSSPTWTPRRPSTSTRSGSGTRSRSAPPTRTSPASCSAGTARATSSSCTCRRPTTRARGAGDDRGARGRSRRRAPSRPRRRRDGGPRSARHGGHAALVGRAGPRRERRVALPGLTRQYRVCPRSAVEDVPAARALAAVGSVVLGEPRGRRDEPAADAHAVAEEVLPPVVPGESEPAFGVREEHGTSLRPPPPSLGRAERPERDDNGPGAAPRLSSRAAPGPHVRQHLLAFAHRARLSLLRAA